MQCYSYSVSSIKLNEVDVKKNKFGETQLFQAAKKGDIAKVVFYIIFRSYFFLISIFMF